VDGFGITITSIHKQHKINMIPVSYYNVIKVSVCLSLDLRQKPARDENGKGTLECASGMGLSWEWATGLREGKDGLH